MKKTKRQRRSEPASDEEEMITQPHLRDVDEMNQHDEEEEGRERGHFFSLLFSLLSPL